MAEKKFTKKVGYDDLLDYDPENGILSYGGYEFFASDLITPKVTKLSFDEYKKQYRAQGGGGMATAVYAGHTDDVIRKQFEAQIKAGSIKFEEYRPQGISGLIDVANSKQRIAFNNTGGINGLGGLVKYGNESQPTFRTTKNLGADTYEFSDYLIPGSVDFVDKIAARSLTIYNSAANQNNDILQQNRADSDNRKKGSASTVLG